ncbi:hypothetical protein BH24ACT26_BH24ACT26_15400 [soil metagenome]
MAGEIRLWEEREERWRWAYEQEGLEILSNNLYPTLQEAQDAARIAYPDAAPREVGGSEARPEDARVTFPSFLLMVVAVWRRYRAGRRT